MNKNKLIDEVIESLELPISMIKDVEKKYETLTSYLEGKGLNIVVKPHGSFMLGTVIKPFKEGEDRDYDLDFFTILLSDNNDVPKVIKHLIGDTLKENKIYRDRLTEDNTCWVLEFKGTEQKTLFKMDIMPSTPLNENETISIVDKSILLNMTTTEDFDNYEWLQTTALLFNDWFLEINKRFLYDEIKSNQFRTINESLFSKYSHVEDIPDHYYKTNLQRAIQYLKRHRDVYYDSIKENKNRPSSFLLTSLITDAVKDHPYLSIEEIIDLFINKYENNEISIQTSVGIVNPVNIFEIIDRDFKGKKKELILRWLKQVEKELQTTEERNFKILLNNTIKEGFYSFDDKKTLQVSATKPWSNE